VLNSRPSRSVFAFGTGMILRLVGAQVDSRLLLQAPGDLSPDLVRSVRVFIGQTISNRGLRTIVSTPRNGRTNWQESLSLDGQNEQEPSLLDADDLSDAGNSSRVSSDWNHLDASEKYTAYASIFVARPQPYLLNVFA
jgi:hypothetical protein